MFLAKSERNFKEKFAIDQSPPTHNTTEIKWFSLDLNFEPTLPFKDNYFSKIYLLAVIEHLNPKNLTQLYCEIYRALIPGGVAVITTPAAWSDRLLRIMARIRLVFWTGWF